MPPARERHNLVMPRTAHLLAAVGELSATPRMATHEDMLIMHRAAALKVSNTALIPKKVPS